MALSGTIDFTLTRNQLIKRALRLIGASPLGQTPSNEEIADAAEVLNIMIKAWSAEGIRLWKLTEARLFLDVSTKKYSLSSAATSAHCATSYSSTTLSAAASNTDSTITVSSISGISSGDYIGVQTSSTDIHWTTVNGAPSGSTVTLTDAMDADAANGNTVWFYTTKINRPLRIVDARRSNTSSIDTPIAVVSREEYFMLPSKDSTSNVNQIYYDPQLTTGYLYVWPISNTVNDFIDFTFADTIQDFDTLTDNPDFPVEWFEAIYYNLAVRLCPLYGVDSTEREQLKTEAAAMLQDAIGWDDDMQSIQIMPAMYEGDNR